MSDAVVLLDDNGDYTVIDYADIEYICVSRGVVKIKVFSEEIMYKSIYITDEIGSYMGMQEAMQYVDRLRE